MHAGGILPVKALLADLDLPRFRAVLASIRRSEHDAASLRDPIAAWARDEGLPL